MPVIRVLGLGNDLLADDGFGIEVVREMTERLPGDVETRSSIAAGFALLDDVLGADRLIVVDAMSSGHAAAGTVRQFEEGDAPPVVGGTPHYVGLFETLRVGRALGLRVPSDVVIIAVETADCLTIGGPMSAEMRAAMPTVVHMVDEQIAKWGEGRLAQNDR